MKQFISLNTHDPHAEIAHLFEKFDPSTWDEVWIPAVAQEDFVIISADRGKGGGGRKGAPLPRLCVKHGLRHVLLSNKLHHQKMFDKMLAIFSVWHQLLEEVPAAAPGARFMIMPTGRGCGKLVSRPLPKDVIPFVPPGTFPAFAE